MSTGGVRLHHRMKWLNEQDCVMSFSPMFLICWISQTVRESRLGLKSTNTRSAGKDGSWCNTLCQTQREIGFSTQAYRGFRCFLQNITLTGTTWTLHMCEGIVNMEAWLYRNIRSRWCIFLQTCLLLNIYLLWKQVGQWPSRTRVVFLL